MDPLKAKEKYEPKTPYKKRVEMKLRGLRKKSRAPLNICRVEVKPPQKW
jgi:hypothetical protein